MAKKSSGGRKTKVAKRPAKAKGGKSTAKSRSKKRS